ncbi:MAG: hypothetical protein QOJ40_2261 [Verrucomicrobiota bacterium]
MPFPVAHPAAILPLRRYCPRYLSFPALIAGSLSPDLGYVFGHLHVDRFSHRFWAGSFGFCLPAGLLMVGAFYLIRRPAAEIMPLRYQGLLGPLRQRPVVPWLAFPVSVLIGAWTHILLDSISHKDGWLVEHIPALQELVFRLGTDGMPGYKVLYAGFTFIGAAWLAYCYLRWLEQAKGTPVLRGPAMRWSSALLFGASILAIAAFRRDLGIIPVGIVTVVVMVGFLAGTAWFPSDR